MKEFYQGKKEKQMKGAKDAQQIDLKNLSPIIIATTSMN